MTRYHINYRGDVGRCNAKKSCPFGDIVDDHFDSAVDARRAYEIKNSGETFRKIQRERMDYRNSLLKYSDSYPSDVINGLVDFLDSRKTLPLTVIPHGSDLYNTSIPGRKKHDYDFVVFTTPEENKKSKVSQHLVGELDVTCCDVTKLDKYVEKSAPLTEAFFAYQSGRSMYVNDFNNYSSYLGGFTPSITKYYKLMSIVTQSHRYEEPALIDGDAVNFKNFKHSARWNLYMQRWGDGNSEGQFDPRLTDGERVKFLRAIESGRMNSIFE